MGISNKEAATRAADMIYALSQGMGMGTRGPGRFVDLLGGTGLAVAGTNREGQTGILFGNKFIPTSTNYYSNGYQNSGNGSDENGKGPGNLVFDPNTGAFIKSPSKTDDEMKKALADRLSQQNPMLRAMLEKGQSSGLGLYQVPENALMMARARPMPSVPNYNPYNMMRYADPRYRGGM